MRERGLLLAIALLAGCGGASPTPTRGDGEEASDVERYFPSAPGTAWSYDVVAGEGPPALVIARVVARDQDRVAISVSGSEPNQYQLRRDGVYSTDAGAYALKWPLEVGSTWIGRGEGLATIVDVDATLDTPAGRFARCVVVREEREAPPTTVETHFCPDVGVARLEVELRLEAGAIRTVTQIRGFSPGGG